MSFLDIFKQQLKLIFSDAAIMLTIIGGVILYSFLYPQPYAKQSISSLSISVVDLDKSDISREITFNIDATPQIDITRFDLSLQDAQNALIKGKVSGIIVIPSHFKRDIKLGKSPTIAVGADSSYFLIYGGVLEAAMKSILTQSAKLKISKLIIQGESIVEAKESYTPYSLNTINLFNKDNSYTQYVVPAVFILILQQTILIGLGILGGGINERIRREENIQPTSSEVLYMMSSNFIIFFSLFSIHLLFYFGFSFSYFEITHIANIGELLNFSFAFLTASIFFGIFLGSLFTSREIATPAVLFSSLPLIFSVGFIWPLEAMPDFVKYFSLIFPSTPAMQGFLGLNQMGASFDMVINQYALLWSQALIYASLSYYFLRRKKS